MIIIYKKPLGIMVIAGVEELNALSKDSTNHLPIPIVIKRKNVHRSKRMRRKLRGLADISTVQNFLEGLRDGNFRLKSVEKESALDALFSCMLQRNVVYYLYKNKTTHVLIKQMKQMEKEYHNGTY